MTDGFSIENPHIMSSPVGGAGGVGDGHRATLLLSNAESRGVTRYVNRKGRHGEWGLMVDVIVVNDG